MTTLLGKRKSFCCSCFLSVFFFCCVLCISFEPGVYVETLNLIKSIPCQYILTLPDIDPEETPGTPVCFFFYSGSVSMYTTLTSCWPMFNTI